MTVRRFRLIKPFWGRSEHPDLIEEVEGPNVVETDLTDAEVQSKNEQGYNVYWFPNDSRSPVRGFMSGRDVDRFRFVFVDMDLKDGKYPTIEKFLKTVFRKVSIQPSIIVRTGNGCHVYWRVKNLTRDDYVRLQLRLIRLLETDKSIWTVLQIMRWFQSKNTKKHGEFKPVVVEHSTVEDPTTWTTVAELDKALPELTSEDDRRARSHLNRIDGKEEVEDLAQHTEQMGKIPESFKKLIALYKDDPEEGVTALEAQAVNAFLNPKNAVKSKGRSEADYFLACTLHALNFSIQDAFLVLSASEKAKEKETKTDRFRYVNLTVRKAYLSASENTVNAPVGDTFDLQEAQAMTRPNDDNGRVYGPSYFDLAQAGWRRKQVLGLVAPSGTGKTTVAIDAIVGALSRSQIQANADWLGVFYNLEMPHDEVMSRFTARIGAIKDEDLQRKVKRRLMIVSNDVPGSEPLNMSLQSIHRSITNLETTHGRKVGFIVIDHIGVLNPNIDINLKPNFDLEARRDGAYENFRQLDERSLPQHIKRLALGKDVFVLLLAQPSKERAGDGDQPLGLGAALGASQFEHYLDYLLTAWQPARITQTNSDLRILGWQYAKLRGKSMGDPVETLQTYYYHVNLANGRIRPLRDDETEEANELIKKNEKARQARKNNTGVRYSTPMGVRLNKDDE